MKWKPILALAALWLGLAPACPAMAQTDAGGTLTIRMNADIRGTDGLNRDANTDMVLHTIFETLVAYRDDLSIGPLLAQSWTVSDDGRTYTFKLRDGATFHNGDKLTSADVKWNWDRRVKAGKDWFCNPYFDGSQGLKVEAVETPDDQTVVFKINEPNALFLAQLANIQCNGWIASPKNVDKDGKWNPDLAIGTGPFKLKDWTKGQSVTLERYADYKPLKEKMSGLAGDRSAYVDEVKFVIIPDTSAAETALYAKQIDILPGFEAARMDEAKQRGTTVLSTPGLSFTPLLIQTRDPLLKNVKLRQAIAHAIDFAQIAQVRTNGLSTFNPSGVAQASAYFDDSFLAWPKYDPAETQKLLAEAGYKGEPITIQTNTRYQGMYDNSVMAQAMLTAAGINAKLETLDWATQLDNYLAGKFQMQSFGYSARLDPSLFYGLLVGNKDQEPTVQWENDKALDLVRQSTKVTDPAKRKELFKQIHALMEQDVPILGLYYEPVIDAVAPGVTGYNVWAGDKTRAWGVHKAK